MELTDSDRAAIDAICNDGFQVHRSVYDEAIYRAGMAAGIERAAHHVEQTAAEMKPDAKAGGKLFADAIRALARERMG